MQSTLWKELRLPSNPNLANQHDLALELIWLFRSDLRRGAKSTDAPNDSFKQWWSMAGRSEYQAWNQLGDRQRDWLAQPIYNLKLEQLNLYLPRALSLIDQYRPDVLQTFTINGKSNPIAMSAWFFLIGLKELLLDEIITDSLIDTLDQPILDARNYQAGDGVPALSVLMRLTWELLSIERKKTMLLDRSIMRENFIAWFFYTALPKYSLARLIANRWRYWLLEEIVPLDDLPASLPRFLFIEYKQNPELQKRFPFNTKNGVSIYSNWARGNLSNKEGRWSWLMSPRLITSSDHQPKVELAETGLIVEKPFGVNLIGFAFAEMGIAEDLRMAVAACEAVDIPYRIVNINLANLRQRDFELQEQVSQASKKSPYAINLFCMPIFDVVERIFLKMGPDLFSGHYNIAWAPWELSVWPKAWKKSFHLFDEIWAGSPFAHEMYRKATIKPSTMVPLAVSVERLGRYTRKQFSLPAKTFLYLYIFDFNSHLSRKNPMAAISGFQKAFSVKSKDKVGLVLKVMHAKSDDPHWLEFERLCQTDPRIHLINRVMDRPEILGLIQACDAYVSPHRAEGFGRTLAEAMLLGKPVVATNYSGNHAFMDPQLTFPVEYELVPLNPGDYHFIEKADAATWAEPSIVDLARQIKAAYTAANNRAFVSQLKKYAQDCFSPKRTGDILKARLQPIYAQLRVKQASSLKANKPLQPAKSGNPGEPSQSAGPLKPGVVKSSALKPSAAKRNVADPVGRGRSKKSNHQGRVAIKEIKPSGKGGGNSMKKKAG